MSGLHNPISKFLHQFKFNPLADEYATPEAEYLSRIILFPFKISF